jgi:hypothetical protein
MDFHLNSLLDLSQATVFTCYHETDFICLHLQLNNLEITCPNCQGYTDNLHDTSYVLIRDLSIFGNLVYLKVPRRKFYCNSCGKYPTEILDWVEKRRGFTWGASHFLLFSQMIISAQAKSRAVAIEIILFMGILKSGMLPFTCRYENYIYSQVK